MGGAVGWAASAVEGSGGWQAAHGLFSVLAGDGREAVVTLNEGVDDIRIEMGALASTMMRQASSKEKAGL
jgi:hypothetical protein